MLTEYHQDRRQVMKRNPNYRGEPYPCEGAPGRQGSRPARRLRQEDAVHRQDRGRRRARADAAARQVPPGLLRPRGVRAHRQGPRVRRREAELRGDPQGLRRQGLPPRPLRRRQQLRARLQHDRSGDRQGRHARAAGEATASCARPSRSRSTGRSLAKVFPQRAGATAMGPIPDRHLRLARADARGHQPGHAPARRRHAGAPLDRGGASS